jgi:hypothetical protein
MRYTDFRDSIRHELSHCPKGLTWQELKSRLQLPYDRPCPTWTRQLETEIGLRRTKSTGRSFLWTLHKTK